MRVDFYLLASDSRQAVLTTACRLLEKAYLASKQALVLAASPSEAALLDEQLWTFRDISFVPHACLPCEDAGEFAVVIDGSFHSTHPRPLSPSFLEVGFGSLTPDPSPYFAGRGELTGEPRGARAGLCEGPPRSGTFRDILLNLTSDLPTNPRQFERILEIVSGDPAEKEQSRDKFRQYRELGFTLHTQPL